MKMNALKFAELIGYFSFFAKNQLHEQVITEMARIIDEGVTSEALPTYVNKSEVTVALINVQDHMLTNNKIEAVKCLRTVTDMSLKEAKDWVERWPVYQCPTQG